MSETWEAVRVLGFWKVVYFRTLYRPLMRWMHRHHLHYAPVGGPDGNLAWCQWCGLRYALPDLQNIGSIRRVNHDAEAQPEACEAGIPSERGRAASGTRAR